MPRNNQLVPIERSGNFNVANNAISMQLLSETEGLNCVTAKLFPISEEKWRKVGEKGEGKRERERDMNENAYAPGTRRIPLVFHFDKEPRLHYTTPK